MDGSAGVMEGLEQAVVAGVGGEGWDGGEQDDGDFAVLGDRLEAGELALDLGAGGMVGGGEHPVGVVDQDDADASVLVKELREGGVVFWPEGADDCPATIKIRQ